MFDEGYIPKGKNISYDRNVLKKWDISPKNMKIRKKSVYSPTKLNRVPHNTEDIHKLADELCEWADKPDSLFMQQFALQKKIAPYLFFKLGKEGKNAYFTQAYEYARAACAVRMMSPESKLRETVLNKLIPVYDTFYGGFILDKENRDHEFQKELRAIDTEKDHPTHITVIQEKVDCPQVPICIDNKGE